MRTIARSTGIQGRDLPSITTSWIPGKLVQAAVQGRPGVDVYKCSEKELALVNEELGANWRPAVTEPWQFTDPEKRIPKILFDTDFCRVLHYCERERLNPRVIASAVGQYLVEVVIFVDWSNGTGEAT